MMKDTELEAILYLQESAAQCRRLARQATSQDVSLELEKLAREYDEDIEHLGAVEMQ